MELSSIQMLIQIVQSGGHSKQNIQVLKWMCLALHYLTVESHVTMRLALQCSGLYGLV